MLRKEKRFTYTVLLLIICLLLLTLGGCDNMPNKINEPQTVNNQEKWYDEFPLNSTEITIWNDFYGAKEIIKITEPSEIASLVNNVDFSAWRKAELEEEYTGVNEVFIQFNDQTTIAMYTDVAYGGIGQGAPDESGITKNAKGSYYMPKEFLETVQQLVEKYTTKAE